MPSILLCSESNILTIRAVIQRMLKAILQVTKLITYLLTPWCRILLEKLTGLQLVKKFPAFYGTRRLITALTSVRQLSLSWANPIQSTYPHPTSWRSILILSTHKKIHSFSFIVSLTILSRGVPAETGRPCDTAAILQESVNETPSIMFTIKIQLKEKLEKTEN